MKIVSFALAFILGTGCASTYYVADDEVYAPVAPPPLRAEPILVAPGPGHVWVPGSWYWTGRDYVWHAGYWARPPAPRQVWVRSGWVWHQGRYRYVPGRWAPMTARPRHPYYHPRRHPPHSNRPHGARPVR